MELVTQVQIMDEAVRVSLHGNAPNTSLVSSLPTTMQHC